MDNDVKETVQSISYKSKCYWYLMTNTSGLVSIKYNLIQKNKIYWKKDLRF